MKLKKKLSEISVGFDHRLGTRRADIIRGAKPVKHKQLAGVSRSHVPCLHVPKRRRGAKGCCWPVISEPNRIDRTPEVMKLHLSTEASRCRAFAILVVGPLHQPKP